MRGRILMVAVASALTLAFAPSAAATYYSGAAPDVYQYIGSSTYDADCLWYYGQARCSGSNSWHLNWMDRDPAGGTALTGFEDNNTIRGFWTYNNSTGGYIHPSDLDMCCYLKAHTTWWSGGSVLVRAYATT